MKYTSSSTAVDLFEHAGSSAQPLDAANPKAETGPSYRTPRSAGVSRDEMNLAEFPLAVLSTRANPDIKTLEFTDSHRQSNGEVVQRKWIITGADKFGLPTSTDDDVVLGLMRMTMDQGFRDRKVYFTRYELLKTLRWSTEGRSYTRLIKSLDRLSGVRIRSSNAFYDNTTKTYQTRNFGIIDAYEIQDERNKRQDSGGEPAKSFFIWSEVLFHSFKAGFVKKLDLDFYFTLRSAVSRRLYRYLDKHFYYRSSVEVPLKILAFEKLGLSRTYQYVSSIKQQLEPAAQELVTNGFLSSYEFEGRGNGAVVRFYAQRAQEASVPERAVAARSNAAGGTETEAFQAGLRSLHGQRSKLVAALISRGMAEAQAKKLLRRRKEDECNKIAQIIAYYDQLVAANDPKISRSPVGFLYRAVELPHKFSIPASFTEGAAEDSAQRSALSRSRPELKIFSSRRSQGAGRERTKQKAEPASAYPVTAEEMAQLRSEVEKRMAFLKTVLRPEHYQQAVEGCILQELAKKER